MKALNLAVVQFTPERGKKEENLSRIQRLMDGKRADIIVLPELCATGYFFLDRDEVAEVAEPALGPTRGFFRAMAERHGAVVIAGFAERDGDNLYNSCLIEVSKWQV